MIDGSKFIPFTIKEKGTTMTLKKAIEILERDLADKIMPHKPGVREAEQLGSNALECILFARASSARLVDLKLPGETDE